MPFRSDPTGGFTPGDVDMADFIDNVWRPFATDAKAAGGLGWIEQTPSRGKGTSPDFEFLFSRGSIGTEEPPFVFMQTAAKTLYMYSGNGVNTAQESFDQPGNPMNEPPADPPGDLGTNANFGNRRCLIMNTVPGSYDGYWVFGGATGEYLHCVIKVNSRHYRHFHVGMLKPLDTSLHADSFYVTNHRWGWLSPDNHRSGSNNINSNNREHQPYQIDHHLPFRNNDNNNVSFGGDARSAGMWVYSPGYGTENYDWWIMNGRTGIISDSGVPGRAVNGAGNQNNFTNMVKNIGDVNDAANAVLLGSGAVSGYDLALGTVPFACDPTFTTDGVALVPIYVLLHSDFESELRWAPVATVPDVFRVNMRTLDPEQEITIGSETYVVFPMINKDQANTVAGEGYSGYEGLAYRKITANAT